MAHPLRLVVSGATGRMGRTLSRLIRDDPALDLAAGLDREGVGAGLPAADLPALLPLARAGEALRDADVLIDFSAPDFLRRLLSDHAEALRGRALVVGTTGLGDEEERLLGRAAERSPVLSASNFSVGVNVLLSLVERAARVLGEEYDVEIVEAHHRRKEDAPSGTALALGNAVARGRGVELDPVRRDGRTGRPGERPAGEIAFHSIRGGEVVGEHQVLFLGELDRIELVHRASDRALFAAGALRAARWLAEREPGRYSLGDVLGLA